MKYDGMIIHSVRDEYGLIEVVDNRVTRKLYFDSPIEQSCLYHNAPMTLNFEYQEKIVERVLEFAERHINGNKKRSAFRVLMLGMGGGSMAHHLFHNHPNLQMTVVELRQAVIDCAYRFFQLPDEPEIEVVQGDAIEFVEDNQHPYDAVIIDIFDADGLPSGMSRLSFQEALWKSIGSPGLLVFNLWYQWDKQANGKPIPTEETAQVLGFWQHQCDDLHSCQLNRYNIQSSQNLILEIVKLD